jgi:hypothetical protein
VAGSLLGARSPAASSRRALRSPSKKAIEILDNWAERVTPLSRARFAVDYLYDSPLVFERKAKAEDTKYEQIKRSCPALERDFNDDSKWTK